jgi:NAD-dependent deacetylase
MIPGDLVAALSGARSLLVLTGAGASAESGIPTFRDAQEGLWSKYNPAELATVAAFEQDPETVTRWYDWRRGKCADAQPNAAHHAIRRLERLLTAQARRFTLVTQNVDRLHQAAGSADVVELHGSLWVWRCTQCGTEGEDRRVPFPEYPLHCACGGLMRPGVVWFGESLPPQALERAVQAAEECDLFLSIGTSAVVYPAAGLAHQARRRGARVGEINAEWTPLSPFADWSLHGRCGELLPRLVELAFGAD